MSTAGSNESAGRRLEYTIYRDIGGAGFSNIGHTSGDAGDGFGLILSQAGSGYIRGSIAINYLDSPSTTSAGTVECPPTGLRQSAILMEIAG